MRRIHDFVRSTLPELRPYMDGPEMIGYGSYYYRYASGREGDSCIVGLSSRKSYISLYAMGGDGDEYAAEKYRSSLLRADIGKSCIRFKRLDDLGLSILARVLQASKRGHSSISRTVKPAFLSVRLRTMSSWEGDTQMMRWRRPSGPREA